MFTKDELDLISTSLQELYNKIELYDDDDDCEDICSGDCKTVGDLKTTIRTLELKVDGLLKN